MGERLSSIETLPDSAMAILARAFDQVSERRAAQVHILNELNEGLHALGLEMVSSSAFNRWALRIHAGTVKRPAPAASAHGIGGPGNLAALSIQEKREFLRRYALAFQKGGELPAGLDKLRDDFEGSGRNILHLVADEMSADSAASLFLTIAGPCGDLLLKLLDEDES